MLGLQIRGEREIKKYEEREIKNVIKLEKIIFYFSCR
jgi:hypothetical protein